MLRFAPKSSTATACFAGVAAGNRYGAAQVTSRLFLTLSITVLVFAATHALLDFYMLGRWLDLLVIADDLPAGGADATSAARIARSTMPGTSAMKALAMDGGTWGGMVMTSLRTTKKR